MKKDALRQIVQEIRVPYVLHFTQAQNLPSIMSKGIFPVSRSSELPVLPKVNDLLRLDGHEDGVSASIGFPNCQMFYKYRITDPTTDWVVLVMNPRILWEKDCAFCKHNAADSRISSRSLEELKGPDSLKGLFAELEGLPSRADQRLKSYDPTDVQAEVLIFDIIEPALIAGAVFEDLRVKTENEQYVGGIKTYLHSKGKGLFATRNYVRKYD
ncbi:MAG TPA: DarT ssDNA thymidine ADP-ribosyltransferase family protein [Pseudomonadota bacterium]|nr:DUF4433 domain-containing protein [Xanthomonadales bacterium]HQW82024.1 DarT ssDNA thymidine ADP-ribosyltransferase family protein [Pseudomonadota bacterium]